MTEVKLDPGLVKRGGDLTVKGVEKGVIEKVL